MTVALARDGGLEGYLAGVRRPDARGRPGEAGLPARRTGFRVARVPRAVVYGLTGAYAVGYVALIVIAPAV